MEFDYARDALKYLIKTFEIKEIYIPYYLCGVIRHAVVKMSCKPIFYHIDDNFYPLIKFPQAAYILYPNYFGVCDKNVDKLVLNYPNMIIDNAHAFYAPPKGFACFNSARKFLPVKKGAHLWIGGGERFIPPDYKRRESFLKYSELLDNNMLKFDIDKDCIPFCYPYLAHSVKEADELVKQLTKEGKTIYRYWNNLPKTYNEYKFYERLVPVPLI